MSDDLEARLRAASAHFPEPSGRATEQARKAYLDAQRAEPGPSPRPASERRRHLTPRIALAFLAFSVFIGASFAAGMRVGSDSPANPTGTPAAGPGFLPAVGWNVIQSGLTPPPGAITALAANVPFKDADRVLIAPPAATIESLGPTGVLLHASFGPAPPGDYPARSLPLRLSEAEPGSMEGFPAGGKTLRLNAYTGGYNIDILIIFGASKPSADVLAAADQELSRLVTPSCPTKARETTSQDLGVARDFVVRWLRVFYVGRPTDLARIEARALPLTNRSASLRDAAISRCGPGAERSMIEVDVTLPAEAQPTTGPGPLRYLVYREGGDWTIWSPT